MSSFSPCQEQDLLSLLLACGTWGLLLELSGFLLPGLARFQQLFVALPRSRDHLLPSCPGWEVAVLLAGEGTVHTGDTGLGLRACAGVLLQQNWHEVISLVLQPGWLWSPGF